MKIGRLVVLTISTILAVAAAVAAVVFFKDQIMEIMAGARNTLEDKKSKLFHSKEFTDYADI